MKGAKGFIVSACFLERNALAYQRNYVDFRFYFINIVCHSLYSSTSRAQGTNPASDKLRQFDHCKSPPTRLL